MKSIKIIIHLSTWNLCVSFLCVCVCTRMKGEVNRQISQEIYIMTSSLYHARKRTLVVKSTFPPLNTNERRMGLGLFPKNFLFWTSGKWRWHQIHPPTKQTCSKIKMSKLHLNYQPCHKDSLGMTAYMTNAHIAFNRGLLIYILKALLLCLRKACLV